MKSVSEIDAVRKQGILSSLAGFPILLVFGIAWIAAGSLSFVVPPNFAPWVYVLLGVPAMPVALALERRVGYVEAPDPDPLLPLTLQSSSSRSSHFQRSSSCGNPRRYVPVAFAAIVGAHFLPFQWVYKTTIYLVLGIIVAVGPFALAVLFGRRSMHYTGFFVGSVLLIGAWLVRAHARAVWVASRK